MPTPWQPPWRKEPFKTVELPPPGLGDRPPCSRTGFGQTDQGSAHCVGRTNASSACSSSGIDYPRLLSIFPTRRTRTSGTVSDSIAHEHSPTTYVCRPRAFRPHRQQSRHRRFSVPSPSLDHHAFTSWHSGHGLTHGRVGAKDPSWTHPPPSENFVDIYALKMCD